MKSIDEVLPPKTPRALRLPSEAPSLDSASNDDVAPILATTLLLAGRRAKIITGLLAALVVLAAAYTLYFARDFLLPIILALLLAGVLRPLVAALRRRRLPAPVATGVVLTGTAVAIVAAAYYLVGAAAAWLRDAPAALAHLETKLRSIKMPLEQIVGAMHRLAQLADFGGGRRSVDIQAGGWDLVELTRQVAMETVVVVVLLYFLLAGGEQLVPRLFASVPSALGRGRALACAAQIEKQISVYLSTVTAINFCLGAAASFVLWLLGVPNPVLWGVLLGVLTFIPYIGPVVAIAVVAFVAITSFDDAVRMVAAPAACAALSAVEGYVVTPVVVGRSLALRPAVVFVALTFWTWLWGVAGAVIAVPTVMTLKIVLDHVASLSAFGRLLGPDRV